MEIDPNCPLCKGSGYVLLWRCRICNAKPFHQAMIGAQFPAVITISATISGVVSALMRLGGSCIWTVKSITALTICQSG